MVFLVSLVSISFTTYYYQIKEYRFDRFFSYLKEKGLVLLFPSGFLRPQLTIRGKNIVMFSVLGVGFYLLVLYFVMLPMVIKLFFAAVAPINAFLFVTVGVAVTGIVSNKKRGEQIAVASKKVESSEAVFIGITGSFGKTSAKEFLKKILASKYKVSSTKRNFNTDIGVAISINESLKRSHEFFIAEMGAYTIGEIERIADFTRPKYGILTGLGNQHVDLFGSRAKLIQAKSELLLSLPEDGLAFVNMDSDGYKKVVKGVKCPVVFYSVENKKADIFAENIRISEDGIFATVNYKKHRFNIKADLIGKHNVSNLLPCIGLCHELGLSKNQIERAISNLNPLEKKLNLSSGLKGATFLDDSYNSNVDGFLAAIETLNHIDFLKKYVVSKGIIELGDEKVKSYQKILGALKDLDMRFLTTGRTFALLDKKNKTKLFKNEKALLRYIRQKAGKDTIFLIEGRFSNAFLTALKT